MSTPAIGVAIVSYNTAPLLRRCLASVAADTQGPVIVVDNGSSDGSAELVSREFPSVRLQVKAKNPGYGAAANLAIRELGTQYVLLLNADTELTPGTIGALAAYLDDHPAVAMAGPRIVSVGGTHEASAHDFPTLTGLLLGAAWRWWGWSPGRWLAESGLGRLLGNAHRHEWRPRSVDWILGAALAIRREAFAAVGGFDEAYFLYHEEVDLCFRLQAIGWEIHYAPVATVLHVGGASTSQRSVETFAQYVRSTQRFAGLRLSRSKAVGVRALLAAVLVARLTVEVTQLAWARDPERRKRLRRRSALWRRRLAALTEGR